MSIVSLLLQSPDPVVSVPVVSVPVVSVPLASSSRMSRSTEPLAVRFAHARTVELRIRQTHRHRLVRFFVGVTVDRQRHLLRRRIAGRKGDRVRAERMARAGQIDRHVAIHRTADADFERDDRFADRVALVNRRRRDQCQADRDRIASQFVRTGRAKSSSQSESVVSVVVGSVVVGSVVVGSVVVGSVVVGSVVSVVVGSVVSVVVGSVVLVVVDVVPVVGSSS